MASVIPAVAVQALLAALAEAGLDREELQSNAGLASVENLEPHDTVPNHSFAAIWALAFEATKDPLLASRVGLSLSPGVFGILDHLGSRATNAAEGLGLVSAYFRLVATNMEVNVYRGPVDRIEIANVPPEDGQRTAEEWTLAIVTSRFRAVIPEFSVKRVFLPAAPDALLGEYRRLWNADVLNATGTTGVELAAGVLDVPNPAADPSLVRTLRYAADRIEPTPTAFDDSARALIYARLDELLVAGEPSLPAVARDLGLSTRSLQRRLAAQDLSFRELLDSYRRDRAVLAIQEGADDMSGLAYSLGYREQSSFSRAFKRWTGSPPSHVVTREAPRSTP